MLLTVKTISELLKRERNFSAISNSIKAHSDFYVSSNTMSRIAKNENANMDTNTLQALSDYFISEFNYMKNIIINLRGYDDTKKN